MTRPLERGDLVWLDFTPHSGHEQAGRRPAMVLSPRLYHQRCRLAIVCPITSNLSPWPWKVALPAGLKITGAILVDQVRSIDPSHARHADRAPQEVVADVQAKLAALLGFESG